MVMVYWKFDRPFAMTTAGTDVGREALLQAQEVRQLRELALLIRAGRDLRAQRVQLLLQPLVLVLQ